MRENVEKFQFLAQFSAFNDEMGGKSDLWRYWNIFLDEIMPVVIDLTKSFRNGDWELHMTAIRKAMPLIFAFWRKHYCRWLPLYYEDGMKLETNFPLLYKSFKQGDFVVQHTERIALGSSMIYATANT